MDDKQASGQRRETGVGAPSIASEDQKDFRGAAEAACPVEPAREPTLWPHWLGILCGRLITRICPSGKNVDVCDGCRLRVYCRCAQDEFEKATILERRLWVALAVCGAGVILYCLL